MKIYIRVFYYYNKYHPVVLVEHKLKEDVKKNNKYIYCSIHSHKKLVGICYSCKEECKNYSQLCNSCLTYGYY